MKNLLLGLCILLSLTSEAWLDRAVSKSTTSSAIYTSKQMGELLKSNAVVCLALKRQAIPSVGYVAKFGKTVAHCTTSRAKADGVLRLNKNNLSTDLFIELNKKGLL